MIVWYIQTWNLQIQNNTSFQYAAKPSKAPTRNQINNALSKLNSGQKKPSTYQSLINKNYLYQQGGKWYSRNQPSGQPAVKGNQQQGRQQQGNQQQGRQQQGNQQQGNQQQGSRQGRQQLSNPNPNPKKKVEVSVGGITSPALLQWKKGGLQVSNNGKNIDASINPNSQDGSKLQGTYRNRNEIALVNNLNKLNNISFNFSAKNTDNIKQHSTGIFFQLKPTGEGGNNAFIRLGIRDGKIAIGYPNKTPQILKDSSGNTFNANGNNNFQFKLNGNSSQLYINGKPTVDFKLPPSKAESTNIKFGLEAVPGTLNDAISGSYKNIDIN